MITAVTRSSPYPDQMITAVTRSSPDPDQMITAVTRSSPYPDQMITAVTRSSPDPDQMVDHHLETRTHRWTPETDLQWGPRHLDIHRGKTPGTSGALTIWLCYSWNKLLVRLARWELPPRLSLVSPKVFSPFCHRWSSGLLSWGHLISNDITDLIAQILFKLSWMMTSLNSIMKIEC